MKLWEIFRFEFAYQARRAWPWLFFVVLLVLSFLMTRDGTLSEALYEEFFVNSPFAIAKTTVVGGLLWLLIAAAVAGEAAARDVATGMHPLVYTLPVSKAEYLGGRFLAALALNSLMLLAIPAAILLGVYAPGVDEAVIGPFRPAAYLTALLFLTLPNAFVATSIQFALALRSGRPMTGYFASFLLFFTGFFIAAAVLHSRSLGEVLDPIGIRVVIEDMSRLWTTTEKSWRLLALEGVLLTNRVFWITVALIVLAVTYQRFRFAHRAASRPWWRRTRAHAPTPAGISVAASAPVLVQVVQRSFGFATRARQTLAIAWDSFRSLAASWGGLVLLLGIPLLTIVVVLDQMAAIAVPKMPTTALVIRELTAPLSAELSRWVIIPILSVLFAGELVWREREAGLGEITDAMPRSEWVPFLGKFLGLSLLLAAFTALQMSAGMIAQAILGHHDFEIGLYLGILFGLQLPEYILFALLALVVHVLVDQKYVGHLVAITAYVVIALASLFGIEHDLLIYSAGPAWSYTEMRGFGSSLVPWLWFKLYWTAWALLLAVSARLFWVRGKDTGVRVRLRAARRRLMRPTIATAAVAVALIASLGAFVFYNTNVLNEYRTPSEIAEQRAEYERRYRQFAEAPKPRLVGAELRVEIHPERRVVDIHGEYRLVNDTVGAIGSVHVSTTATVGEIELDRPATRVNDGQDLGHRIYALETPLAPGDALRLDFQVKLEPRGFRETGVDSPVVENGTYFTNSWLPAIGYQESRELMNAGDRRDHGLSARPLIPSLDDPDAWNDRVGGIDFEAVVSTSEDQVAVAPGALRRTWTENGRRYFQYSSDEPIGGEWAFFAADYAVHEAEWAAPPGTGPTVSIRIFHHPAHTMQLDRMVRSIRASLDYYTREFGPYRYGHLTVVERPGNGTGMHADTTMLTFSEGFALWGPNHAPGQLDMPFAVMAHEVAHQWTVPSAFVEGAPVLSEGLAWYYAMQLVENVSGLDELRRLQSFMRDPYPIAPIKRGEPLIRGLDPYSSYRKGPFALYALSEYMGDERVNGALRRLVEKHRSAEAPLATMLDLYRELEAATPDSLKYLLHDLFQVNTCWVFEIERATAMETDVDTWRVTLDVRARKVVADTAGAETEVPLDEWVEIGIFARAEHGGELSAPLHLEKHRIVSGTQTITVTVPRRPELAGIDPFHVLDWEEGEDDDNIEEIRIDD